jgi:hypothetical protein
MCRSSVFATRADAVLQCSIYAPSSTFFIIHRANNIACPLQPIKRTGL